MLWFWSDMYKRIALPHFFLSFQKALLIPQRSKKEGGWKEMARPQFAMIGMGVMGSALAKNFAEKGLAITIYNRTAEKTKQAYDAVKHEPFAKRMHPVLGDIPELVSLAGKKGAYFIMVKAGAPTEEVIAQLAPLLSKGALLVDFANSHFTDTWRRSAELSAKGIHFFGAGVSGGEEGARHGPSIMPGGFSREVYEKRLKKALEAVAAKAPQDGKPCVAFIGAGGAGHYVKMVHNAIEYADMQLIAEAYDLMRKALGMDALSIAEVFEAWNKGVLESYLIEITSEVLKQEDPFGKGQLVDFILDSARMKGTGTWTVANSLTLPSGVVAIPGIYAAVEGRAISARRAERVALAKKLGISSRRYSGDRQELIDALEQALFTAKIACYAQGIELMQLANKEYSFGGPDISTLASIWRAGCIIRAKLLGDITRAYAKDAKLSSLLAAPAFSKAITSGMESLAKVCCAAAESRVPLMAFDASRNYILQYASRQLPANLTQAQRDFFGAHTYERTDRKGAFHTEWGTKKRKEAYFNQTGQR